MNLRVHIMASDPWVRHKEAVARTSTFKRSRRGVFSQSKIPASGECIPSVLDIHAHKHLHLKKEVKLVTSHLYTDIPNGPRFYWLKPWQFNDIHEVFIAPDSNFYTRWSNRLRVAVESTLGRSWIDLVNGRINGSHANVTFNLLLNITCNVH